LIVRAGGAVAPIFRERLSAQTCFPKSAANDARTDGRTSRRDVKRVRIRCILFVSSAEERTQFLDSIGRAFLFAPLFTESVPPPPLSLSLSLSVSLHLRLDTLHVARAEEIHAPRCILEQFPVPSTVPLPRPPPPLTFSLERARSGSEGWKFTRHGFRSSFISHGSTEVEGRWSVRRRGSRYLD